MNDIYISVENPTTVQRPSPKIRKDEEFEIIPFSGQNDDTIDEQDISDRIPYCFFLLNFVIIHILPFIETSHGYQNINLVHQHMHFSCFQSYQ